MMKQALQFFPLKYMPMLGLVLFLIMFLCVVSWVFRKGSDEYYKKISEIPFENDKLNRRGEV